MEDVTLTCVALRILADEANEAGFGSLQRELESVISSLRHPHKTQNREAIDQFIEKAERALQNGGAVINYSDLYTMLYRAALRMVQGGLA